MARIAVEPNTPDWWGRAAKQIEATMGDRPTAPSLLYRAKDTASLPAASAYPLSLAFNVALGVPVISDGAFWYPVTLGAHL